MTEFLPNLTKTLQWNDLISIFDFSSLFLFMYSIRSFENLIRSIPPSAISKCSLRQANVCTKIYQFEINIMVTMMTTSVIECVDDKKTVFGLWINKDTVVFVFRCDRSDSISLFDVVWMSLSIIFFSQLMRLFQFSASSISISFQFSEYYWEMWNKQKKYTLDAIEALNWLSVQSLFFRQLPTYLATCTSSFWHFDICS